MKSAWRRSWDFVRPRFWAFTFMVMLVPQLTTAWHSGDHIWLAAVFAILISMAIAAILEIQWFKTTAIRRTAAKVITPAAVVVALVSIFLAFWRQSQRPNGVSESVWQPNAVVQQVVQRVVPTALQITPAQATQGETVEVTIATTTPRFTQGSIPHFGPGITVLDSHSTSEQTLVSRIKLDAATPPGTRRIWVTTQNPQIAIDDSPRGAFSVVTSIRAEK
ncbi:MAG TPA: hypothetical protein VKB88_19635 [Bryobacteraceae bacterium]|nr:hypothetical protein [Bryobacteraceae bacterium]